MPKFGIKKQLLAETVFKILNSLNKNKNKNIELKHFNNFEPTELEKRHITK